MKKDKQLVTITAGGEPITTNVSNATSVLVNNDTWFFYNKGHEIFVRRIIDGNLETTDYRVVQGNKPVTIYNSPYIYLFFERDDKSFVKKIHYNDSPATFNESSSQDNYGTPNIQKHDFDAFDLGFSDFDATWNTIGQSYFYISGGTFTIDVTKNGNYRSVYILLAAASFVNTSYNYCYGMIYSYDGINYNPLWEEEKIFNYENYIFNNFFKRPSYIRFRSVENNYTSYYDLNMTANYNPTNDKEFMDLGFSDFDATWNTIAITANYDYIKLPVSEPIIVDLGFSDFDATWNTIAITANYDYVKLPVSEPIIVDLGFSDFDATWNTIAINLIPDYFIYIESPKLNENINDNSQYYITWQSKDLANVDIFYSIDSGSSWITIATNVNSSGGYSSYTWTTPDVNVNTSAKLKISKNTVEHIIDFNLINNS